eukprot:3232419-Alexandrium_andersonii.AAC.1
MCIRDSPLPWLSYCNCCFHVQRCGQRGNFGSKHAYGPGRDAILAMCLPRVGVKVKREHVMPSGDG